MPSLIDGATVVVGAPDCAMFCTGDAYVFHTTDGGATYDQVAKLTAGDAANGDQFGISVAIAGDIIVIGAYQDGDDGLYSGSAYVFRTTDGGASYVQVAKLTADDAATYDYFGRSVAIAGGTVVVGAYGDEDGGSDSGSAYVFDANALTALGSDAATPQPTSNALGSDAATRTGPLLALLVAAVLAL